MLRTATAGLAARLDFTLDEIEDLRMAVDEACALLLASAVAGTDLTCAFELDRDGLRIAVTVASRDGVLPRRDTFAWTVLTALAGGVDARVDAENRVTVELHKRRGDPSGGGNAGGGAANAKPPGGGRAAGGEAASDRATDRTHARSLFVELAKRPEGDATRTGMRDELVTMHMPLVEYLARRFRNRGEPLDDLVQVATIGLIKSIDRFDTERGVEFSTYATPTIVGEIKRHFRDKGWAIRVPRRLQELKLALTKTTAELSQELGRSPTVAELAGRLGMSEEDVLEGLESANAYAAVSLDAPEGNEEGSSAVADSLGEYDENLDKVEYREALKPLLDQLPVREKKDPHAAFLRQHDAVADRRPARHLADACLPAARPHPGAAPRGPAARGLSSGATRRRGPSGHPV